MKIISIFILPFIIATIPLLIILACKKEIFKHSFRLTLTVSIISILIGLATPLLACVACAKGLSSALAYQPHCVTGAAMFLPIGCIFTIITLCFAIYYCITSYKLKFKSNLKEADPI